MGWSVVERFVESKCDVRESEDVIVVTDDFAAVIDGATDETGAVFDGKSGGRFAAEAVRNAIERLPSNVTAREFADELTRSLTAAVHEAAGDLAPMTRWPSASLVCLSIFREEIWRIGDCNFTVDGMANIGSKRVDDAAYGLRAAVNAALLRAGTPLEEILQDDPGTEAARVLFDLQQQLTNLVGPWGYGCINGRPVPDEFIEVFPLERDAAEVVLTTDGYPTVEPTLSQAEERLGDMIEHDPAAIDQLWTMGKCLRPGFRSMDDRAYLRLARRSENESIRSPHPIIDVTPPS